MGVPLCAKIFGDKKCLAGVETFRGLFKEIEVVLIRIHSRIRRTDAGFGRKLSVFSAGGNKGGNNGNKYEKITIPQPMARMPDAFMRLFFSFMRRRW